MCCRNMTVSQRVAVDMHLLNSSVRVCVVTPLRFSCCSMPKNGIPANVVYQGITDLRQLDHNPRLVAGSD